MFTGEDTAKAGFGVAPPLVKFPGRGGMMLKIPHRDVLANGRVRFVGQEVALVVAKTAAAAQDAAEAIEVEYRDLPLVIDAEQALAPGAPQLHQDIAGNLCFDFEYGDEAKTNEAFSRAAHVTRLTLEAQRMVGNPMEPKACLAAYDAATDSYDLYSSSQGMSHILSGLTGIFGLPESKFRAHARDVGGGFGIRSDAYVEYSAALLAAKTLGRPVKWVSSRSETFVSDYHGRDVKLNGRACARPGRRVYRHPLPVVLQHGRVPVAARAHHQHDDDDRPRGERVPDSNGLRAPQPRADEHDTDHRIPGRRPAQRFLHHRAAGGGSGAGDGHGPARAASAEPHSERGVPVPDPDRRLRQRRSAGIARSRDRAIRNGTTFDERRAESKRNGKLRGIGCAVFIEPSGGGSAPKEEVALKFGDFRERLDLYPRRPVGAGA